MLMSQRPPADSVDGKLSLKGALELGQMDCSVLAKPQAILILSRGIFGSIQSRTITTQQLVCMWHECGMPSNYLTAYNPGLRYSLSKSLSCFGKYLKNFTSWYWL